MTPRDTDKQSPTNKNSARQTNGSEPEQEAADALEREPASDDGGSDTSGTEAGAGATESREGAAGLTGDSDAARERYLRLAAEFDNFRKRTERERTESWTRAQAQLVERLLDPLDDLQRVAHVDAEKTSVSSLLEGVQMVERKLLRILEGAGLEMVEAEGQPFDPEAHEAIMTSPTEERESDDTVAEVFQTGYRFKGTLLRPARVRVNKFEG